MKTLDPQSVPQHDHNGHTAYRCLDCGHTWEVPVCSRCGQPSELWYPTGPDNDDSDGYCLNLCVGCALEMCQRLTALACEILDGRAAGLHTSTGTATPANRAQRRYAARRHPVTAISRRERGRYGSHA